MLSIMFACCEVIMEVNLASEYFLRGNHCIPRDSSDRLMLLFSWVRLVFISLFSLFKSALLAELILCNFGNISFLRAIEFYRALFDYF